MKNRNDFYPYPGEHGDDDEMLKYCCPSASWGDMTGLIPYALQSDNDAAAYNEVYPFLPNDENDQKQ